MIEETTLAKVAGVLAGAVLALVFVPPKTIHGFFQRLTIALVVGAVGSETLRVNYLGWPDSWDNIIAAHAITAFSSWWILGILKGIPERIAAKKLEE